MTQPLLARCVCVRGGLSAEQAICSSKYTWPPLAPSTIPTQHQHSRPPRPCLWLVLSLQGVPRRSDHPPPPHNSSDLTLLLLYLDACSHIYKALGVPVVVGADELWPTPPADLPSGGYNGTGDGSSDVISENGGK